MAALEQSRKRYQNVIEDGRAAAARLAARSRVSVGPLSLNLAVGHPEGVRMGRFVQIVGPPSSGKTTLVQDIIAQYQQKHPDEYVLYLDLEYTFDPDYAAACGVNLDRILLIHPEHVEQGFTIVEQFVSEDHVKLVVIDSVAAARPSSEDEKTYEQSPKVASVSSIVTRFCMRMQSVLYTHDALVVLVNQVRMNMNTMSPEKEVPFGGKALAHDSSVIISTARIKTEDTRITTQAIVKKNKTARPNRRSEFFIDFGTGVNHAADIINLAVIHGVVQKSGAWFVYNGAKAQGMDRASTEFPIAEIRERLIADDRDGSRD